MANLKKQLEILAPLLNTDQTDVKLQLSLLKIHPEEYYTNNIGNLIHQLGLENNQYSFISFEMGFSYENLESKLKTLLKKNGSDANLKLIERSKWVLNIDGTETELGALSSFYNWVVNSEEILSVPDFYKNLALALQPHLKNGHFYFGYLKDEYNRSNESFCFLLVYSNDKTILTNFNKFEWKMLGNTTNAKKEIGKVGSVSYEINETKTEFKWKSIGNTLTFILFACILLLGIAYLENILKLSGREIPYPILIYSTFAIIPLWILDYFNRLSKLIITNDQLIFEKGYLAFFPGYKRKTFARNEVAFVRSKYKASWTDDSDSSIGSSRDYSLYLLTDKAKEVRIIKLLKSSECDFIVKKIKTRLNLGK
jgi:hypothetical protein